VVNLIVVERNPPTQCIVNSGILPIFVEFLSFENYPLLQFEACWVITNIVANHDANQFIGLGRVFQCKINILQELLKSASTLSLPRQVKT
jgi:hypothetical protein